MKKTLFAQVDEYIESNTCQQSDLLNSVRMSSLQQGIPDISVSPNQGQFLQILARSVGSKRILELGTLAGYSTLWLAGALPDDGEVLTLENDPRHAACARKHFALSPLDNNIELREGNALDLLKDMIDSGEPPFDFVFMDADKQPYLEYFQLCLQLTRKGSLIICDNVIRNGAVLEENSTDEKVVGVQRLNAWLKHCDKVSATIIQNVGVKEYDGMIIAIVL